MMNIFIVPSFAAAILVVYLWYFFSFIVLIRLAIIYGRPLRGH